MKIESIRPLGGPNVYSHEPVVIMRFEPGELKGKTTRDMPEIVSGIMAVLPELREHKCKLENEGSFADILQKGTHFNHVAEHAAIEMLARAGVTDRKSAICTGLEDDDTKAVIETTTVETTRYVMNAGLELIDSVRQEMTFSVDERVHEAKKIAAYTELGPSTTTITDAAERRGIPWSRDNDQSLVQLGYGKNLRLVQAALTDRTSCIGVDLAGDKDLTKQRLRKYSIPVPDGEVVSTEEEAIAAFESLGPPVVVKPLDGRQGKGVSLDLTSIDDVRTAFHAAKEYSSQVLVEELFEGNNYRLLVVNGEMVAASERLPCYVTGDGQHTISELIEIENKNPLRGEGHEKPLTQIKITPILTAAMQKAGRKLEDIPATGERVMLCGGMNLSTGGTARDVTDDVHPTIQHMCERAARVMSLDICGVDLVVKDISRPIPKGSGGIIEINAAPGLRMHRYPSEGRPRDVGSKIIDMLYPDGSNGRIPIISVTGTNGKTTVTRMIGHILSWYGLDVGMTTTDGILMNGEVVTEGDTTGPISARSVLGDPATEVAVLETARGGIVRRGLGYDWSDVSVLTNISEDHIGQDGIESVDDLIRIKALIAERVRAGGTLVLNADDPNSLRVLERKNLQTIRRKIIYFSLDEDNPVIQRHLLDGGQAFFAKDGVIVEAIGKRNYAVMDVAAIPVTMNGMAEFEVANSLAAIAACTAHGLPIRSVFSLKTFQGESSNPGRNNLYRVGKGYVLIDYGHNPAAFEAICRMAARWEGKRTTGIISVPGDRNDELIAASGRVAAHGFDRVIIKEDTDLRGRESGEVARLLCETVTRESPNSRCDVVLDEMQAFSDAIRDMIESDVVVLFYDKLPPVLDVLNKHNAVPVDSLTEFLKPMRSEVTA